MSRIIGLLARSKAAHWHWQAVAASELEPESCGLSHWPLSESHSLSLAGPQTIRVTHWQSGRESPGVAGPGGPGLGLEFELDITVTVT